MFVHRQAVSVVLMFCCATAIAQVPGQNINMVSGTNWPAGDPYLQRQNEPSMAVSSRNPEHLLGGANDYRTVDIPNPAAPTILGDAWLGVYSSMDGGETFKSTLLPGYPQDTSSAGKASPLHSFTVATDPTVRAGTHGMFYYSGLVFNRGAGTPSGVFVATFQDQNNKGQGNAAIQMTAKGTGNPFLYIGADIVDSGNSGQFLDKPWIVVDIPRSGRTATCKINGQTFSSGYVYVVYTQFNGSQNNPSSKIKEVTSTNCGATWSMPQILSQSQKLAQGTVAAVDPTNGNVYIAWRQIAVAGNQNQPDAIQYAVSTNGGNSFAYEPAVYTFTAPTTKNAYPPGAAFDQPQATTTTFRSLDVPTMAVDANSRVWVAFSQRVNGPTAGTYGSRIMITTLPKGSTTWTTPYAADSTAPSTSYGHQFMPALNFAYGKMMLAWFDSRRDNLESVLNCPANKAPCTDLSQVTPEDVPIPGSTIATPATIFTPYISDPNNGVRHTIDVFGGVINPSGSPTTFKGFQISQYPYYVDDANGQIEQGFFNPPNLPMFVQGTTPFMGDYIDIASQNILPSGNSWIFNTLATDSTGATNAPDFHVTWTDNRDVVPPPVVNGGQDWTQYVPPNGGNSGISTYSGTGSACPSPTCSTVQPACSLAGGTSAYTGDRNQNVYTSRISNGLVVRFKENTKPLSNVQRSFSLLVKNTVSPLSTTPLDSPSYYRILLGVTATSQAPSCTVTGGTATLPGTPNCYLDVAVNPKTTLTQAITVNSTSANPSVNVLVAQINAIPPAGAAPTYTKLQALAVINGDASNPSVADPDFLTSDNDDPDVESPYGNLPIASGEEYDPTVDGPPDQQEANAGIFTPKIGVPAIFTPKIGNVANSAPAIATPTVFTPKITSVITNQPITSIQIANPTIVNTIFTPKIFTPKIFTPKIVSPDIFTPKITDLSDGSNGGSNPVTDYSWKVANKGNTSASYSTTEFAKSSGVSCCPANCSAQPSSCTITGSNPAGPNCSVCQLVQHKVYESPAANRDATNMNATCDLTVQEQYVTVANVPDPAFGTVAGGSPSDPTTSTLSLSPGEGNRVTLRVVATPVSQTVGPFKTVATSFSTDKGQNQPAGSLTITTGALPVAVVGQSYSTSMMSLGGLGTTAWSLPSDPNNPVPATLPVPTKPLQGLSSIVLNQAGLISSANVTDNPGTYNPISLEVQDSAPTTPALDVQQVPLLVNKLSISSITALSTGVSGYLKANGTANVAVTIENDGPATASSVTPTLHQQGTAAGGGPLPVLSCGAALPLDIGPGSSQTFMFTCTAGAVNSGNGTVAFSATGIGTYHNAGAPDATGNTNFQVQPPSPSLTADTTLPVLSVVSVQSNSQTYTPGNWTNHPVTITYACSDNLSGVSMNPMITVINPSGPSGAITVIDPLHSTAMVTLTADSANTAVSASCQDVAGNTANAPATISPIKIDQTKPIVTVAAVAGPNNYAAGTWTNQSVTVMYTCTDNLSGSVPPTLTVTGLPSGVVPVIAQVNNLVSTATMILTAETAATTLAATCSDVATNTAVSLQFGPIMIDKTPPALSATAVAGISPYTAGSWTNQNVTVTFACVDTLSAVANSGVSSFAPAQQIFNTETSNGSSTGTCTDLAGNVSMVTFSPVMIDKTPPVLSVATTNADSSAYTPGTWTNQSVTVTYTCNDNGSPLNVNSGVAAGSPTAPQTFTQETTTAGTGTTGTCSDNAGNIATTAPLSSGTILIDKTPPTVTAVGNIGSSGGPVYTPGTWTNQSVVVTFSCNDALSGPQPGSITGNTIESGQGTYTANGTCQDVAGNTGNGSFGPVQIDTTTPSVLIAAPMQTTYILNQQITSNFTCGDGSGGDTVTCTPTPGTSPYSATPVGPGTFSVHAVDQAGNATNPDPSVSYLVIYKFTGFQAPLQNAVMTPYPSGSYTPSDSGYFILGATIPVAWQLQDAASTVISDLTTLTSIVAYPNATCAGPATGTGTNLYTSGSGNPAFSFTDPTFTFNWDTTTMSAGCYNLVVTTNDTAQWSTIVHLGQTFAVGNTPDAIVSDGTNMWVPAYGSNYVTKLQISTGAVLGTYAVGQGPDGVGFDGANIWVANTTDGTVTELSASTGATLGTFTVGSQPWGIAFDGANNIWVTNRGSNNVTKLSASTGAMLGTYAVGGGPYGIAFDGTNMWVANDSDGTVTELVASTGALVGTYPVGASPVGVAFDRTNIWVADQTNGVGTVTKLAPTGAVIGTYPAGPAPNDLVFDETNIWVTNNGSNTVTKLVASSGATVGTYTVGTGPYGIAFDGTNIWVTVPGSNTVTKLPEF